MRKSLDIKPYNFLSSYEQSSEKANDIHLLIHNNEIVGSVACYGSEIDDLIVSKKFQNNGYGRQLLLWGMQHIGKTSDKPIILHVAQWNKKQLSFTKRLGLRFRILKECAKFLFVKQETCISENSTHQSTKRRENYRQL